MHEVSLHRFPHARDQREITRLAIAPPQPGEDADDLGVPLRAEASGRKLVVERQTMAEEAGPVTLKLPSGATREIELAPAGDGLFRAEQTLDEFGLVEATDGELTALAHVGAVDAPEFRAAVSSVDVLAPVASATGGLVARVDAQASNLPQILPVRSVPRAGGDRMNLRASAETELLGVRSLPLFGGFLGLAVLILALGATWYREGR